METIHEANKALRREKEHVQRLRELVSMEKEVSKSALDEKLIQSEQRSEGHSAKHHCSGASLWTLEGPDPLTCLCSLSPHRTGPGVALQAGCLETGRGGARSTQTAGGCKRSTGEARQRVTVQGVGLGGGAAQSGERIRQNGGGASGIKNACTKGTYAVLSPVSCSIHTPVVGNEHIKNTTPGTPPPCFLLIVSLVQQHSKCNDRVFSC